MLACTDSATLFNTFAVLCTQHRWCRVPGKTSSSAFQKPSAPSPTAISGVIFNPRLFTSMKFAPALRAFPNANLETDDFLLALRRSPNQHQHAFAVVFHASLQEYTVGPHIQVSARRQISLLPMPVLAL